MFKNDTILTLKVAGKFDEKTYTYCKTILGTYWIVLDKTGRKVLRFRLNFENYRNYFRLIFSKTGTDSYRFHC